MQSSQIRILKNGGEITFIISKDESLSEEDRKDKEALHQFLVNNIFPHCVRTKNGKYIENQKRKFTIREVEVLPYLYSANEKKIIVAPYFQNIDNNQNLMFVLNRSCDAGQAYSRDFQSIIRKAAPNKWKSEYIKAEEEKNSGST